MWVGVERAARSSLRVKPSDKRGGPTGRLRVSARGRPRASSRSCRLPQLPSPISQLVSSPQQQSCPTGPSRRPALLNECASGTDRLIPLLAPPGSVEISSSNRAACKGPSLAWGFAPAFPPRRLMVQVLD